MNEKILKRISSNIKRIRKSTKLTQEDMRTNGFNYRHYQKLESGNYSFNLQTLFKLAEVFEVDISKFFMNETKKKKVLQTEDEVFLSLIGDRLRKIRNAQNLTLEAVEKLGLKSWKHLQRVETGKNVTILTLRNLCKFYGITLSDLLRD